MPRIALLTLEDRTGYVIDDELAIAELRRRNIEVCEVPWSDTSAEWSTFDLVIVRTTWDYHLRPDEFLDALARIEASGTLLENPRELILWNLDKRYLRALDARGVPIVPSVWGDGGTATEFAALFARLGCDEIVVKPVVSANAVDTFRLRAPLDDTQLDTLVRTFAARAWFAQPFVQAVLTEGEFSLFYFDGTLSHAVRKVPLHGDFRVQEEHGGSIAPQPVTPELRHVADHVIRAVAPAPFQARVDLVRLGDGTLALMELEMIEPSLYFRMDVDAPGRFADAVDAVLARHAAARHATAPE
jgi:glutathione synthase/RimK-type ligase-like ATP-grasp enzyme